MDRFQISIVCTLVAASPWSPVRAADEPPAPPPDFEFEMQLTSSDLDAITMLVLQSHPILGASPGIKYARGERGYPSGESAHVVFYPHSDTRGVKNALQTHCFRDVPENSWSCPIVQVRRYVQLDTQDFEVRVVAGLDLDAVLALAEATRSIVLQARPNPSVDTLMVIFAVEGGYHVGWGSEEAHETVTLKADLREGGNAANATDWIVAVLEAD